MLQRISTFACVIYVLAFSGQLLAEEKLTIKQLHMCCGGCASEVETILGKVQGITDVSTDKASRSATFTATDNKVAQKAIDALAEGGFYGDTGRKDVAFKNDSGAKAGTVTSLTVTGFHNSCPGCVKSFRVALKKVEGVSGDNCKSKVTTCEVKGKFDAVALIEALNQEGFHVKVK